MKRQRHTHRLMGLNMINLYAIDRILERIAAASGLQWDVKIKTTGRGEETDFLNGKLNVVDMSGFSFCAPRSFAIQIIGT
jgi:hypothetical protein